MKRDLKNNRYRQSNIWLCGLLIVSFLLSLAAVPARSAQAREADPPGPSAPAPSGVMPIPPPGAVSLVRVGVNGAAGLRVLAQMQVEIYTQLSGQDGIITVILPASAARRTALAQHGLAVQILETEIGDSSYYLLYGLPEALEQARQEAVLLWVDGRQALARATTGQIDTLKSLGLRTTRLAAHPLSTGSAAVNPSLVPEQPGTASPVVQGMIDQVSQDLLQLALERLSGERPVSISGITNTLTTRFTPSETMIQLSTHYAHETLAGYGLNTSYDPYAFYQSSSRRNVIAEQTGLTEPDRIFLLTAHLDSTSNLPWDLAPGADDNASGAVAVMQAARILSQYDFGCTLRYALFTGEEQGLYGSADYAGDVLARGDNIQGVLNLDMLGYNTPSTPATLELHTRPGEAGDLAIASLFSDTVKTYDLSLFPQVLPDNLRASDHAAFWERGYSAILAIEDWKDHTPHYHRVTDRVQNMNLSYYTEMVKAALGTFAHMGCLLDGQASGVVRDSADHSPLVGAEVAAWQDNRLIRTVKTGTGGRYVLPLLPGEYRLVFSAHGHQSESQPGVNVEKDNQTLVDRDLAGCDTVQSPAFVYEPLRPGIGQSVTFTASAGGGAQPLTYSWTFGDSTNATGQQVTHTYNQPGLYPVTLSVDNSCAYPQLVTRNLAVGLNVLYVPVVTK